MAQPNSKYGDSIYFPYTAGSLIAYAFEDLAVARRFTLGAFIYKKEDVETVVGRMEEPFLTGFSCYLWNYEYNKALAAAIKKKWPACVTVFGGHQISRGCELEDDPVADVLMYGEGEENFRSLLKALAGEGTLDAIPNLMFRRGGEKVFTPQETVCIPERVSPYLKGWFDDLMRTEKEYSFSAILETNRGCPNRCAFCDWGNIKSRVRQYDKTLVFAEIDWFSKNRIEYVYCTDANFGLFPRDEEFVDYVINKFRTTGYPKKFQTAYSKNNPETVFRLNKKFNDAGMNKGATLSFQSLSPAVLENIYRKNMPLKSFQELMRLYYTNGIAAYSELILGLPGETYESFRDGMELLLENGQHMAINFFNCELLANSAMGQKEYIEKYGIVTRRMEQNQYHILPETAGIREYSRIVVATASMPEDRWIDANIIGIFVRAFHNLGLLQCFAIYLYYEKGERYTAFYERLIAYAAAHPDTVCGQIYAWLRKKYREVLDGCGALTWRDPAFGQLNWPMEESVFLMVVRDHGRYCREIRAFLKGMIDDEALLEDLWTYQNAVVKTPFLQKKEIVCRWNWRRFFADVYENKTPALEARQCRYLIDPGDISSDFPTFAMRTIWFGRRGGQNIVSDIKELPDDV